MYRTYREGLGAGPGEATTYYLDLPQPWGRNTEVTIPVDALVNDAMAAAQPTLNAAIVRGVVGITAAMVLAVGLGAWLLRR